MSTNEQRRILTVEDDPAIRRGVRNQVVAQQAMMQNTANNAIFTQETNTAGVLMTPR